MASPGADRPGRRLPRVGAVSLAALWLLGGSATLQPYLSYREAHPEVGEEDLLEVQAGDSLERVLAVLHHPHAGFDATGVRLLRRDRPDAPEVAVEEALASGAPRGFLVGAVGQRCSRARPGAQGDPFSSWFLLQDGRLRVWSLQAFGADCRPEDPMQSAADHAAMRVVGEELFARARRGPFRYGPLGYEEWDAAFASPSPEAMLSLLEATGRARPHDPHAWNRLAVGRYALGQRDAALEALERAVDLASSWSVPHRNLAVAHRLRGDLAAAAEAREHADWLGRAAVGTPPPAAGP